MAASGYGGPLSCFRVRSWCHQWLSLGPEEPERVSFRSSEEATSCKIILRPCDDGLYKLQVLGKATRDCKFDRTATRQEHDLRATQSECGDANLFTSQASLFEDSKSCHCKEEQWFLCRRDSLVGLTQRTNREEDLRFSLEFDEHGRVRIRGGYGSGYLTADARGRLWAGTQRAQKWEHFTLVEEALDDLSLDPNWAVNASVRVTLQAHTGKFLCGSMPVIGASAEVACCCEEFLLDLKFPALLGLKPSKSKSRSNSQSNSLVMSDKPLYLETGSVCTIRTADGKRMLSAEPDGILFTTKVDQVNGMEKFVLEVGHHGGYPTLSIRRHSSKGSKCRDYISVAPSGEILCNRAENRKWETLTLSLANGSRVLIQSIHGGFLTQSPRASVLDARVERGVGHGGGRRDEQQHRGQLLSCTCLLQAKEEMLEMGAWQLRSHGDSLYTLVAVPIPKGGAQVYLCVDSNGRLFQSSEPSLHFPASSSLFEILPVSGACLDTMDEEVCSFGGIVGFTIRTVRRIHGQQRYLSVEPSGNIFATRTRPSRWEIFHFIDVDATASDAVPDEFSCLPAAINLSTPASLSPWHPGLRSQQRAASLGGYGGLGLVRRVFLPPGLGVAGSVQAASVTSPVASIAAAEALKRASGATAEAVKKGLGVPKRSTATLQDLCIRHISLFASAGSGRSQNIPMESSREPSCLGESDIEPAFWQASLLDPELVELVGILNSNTQASRIPAELVEGNVFNIPDDLLNRIWTQWQSRQHPQQSCKLPNSLLPPEVPPHYQNGLHAPRRLRGNPFVHQRLPEPDLVRWGDNGEGWHCGSCDTEGVLAMDPAVNPAHHRYLEVQHRAVSGARQPTGALWNAISFAGVSLMTTTLACRVISFCRVATSAH